MEESLRWGDMALYRAILRGNTITTVTAVDEADAEEQVYRRLYANSRGATYLAWVEEGKLLELA